MGKKKNASAAKEEGFKEFSFESGMKVSGRLYPGKESKGITRSFMYLDMGYGFTIQCYFVETKDNYFIAFPQYETEKDGKKSYKSYVYVEKESVWAECLDKLADYIYTDILGNKE